MTDVFIVQKNADFTEGRGPMCLHLVFETYKDAYDYIQDQDGIYGSAQYKEPYSYYTKQVEPVTHWSFNGYDITQVKVKRYHSLKVAKVNAIKKDLLLTLEKYLDDDVIDSNQFIEIKKTLKL